MVLLLQTAVHFSCRRLSLIYLFIYLLPVCDLLFRPFPLLSPNYNFFRKDLSCTCLTHSRHHNLCPRGTTYSTHPSRVRGSAHFMIVTPPSQFTLAKAQTSFRHLVACLVSLLSAFLLLLFFYTLSRWTWANLPVVSSYTCCSGSQQVCLEIL